MSITTTSGSGLGDDVQGVAAVLGRPHHLDAVERGEQRDQSVAHDLVVVDDHDADVTHAGTPSRGGGAGTGCSGSHARTMVPPPPGHTTSLRPPSSPARSRSESRPMPACRSAVDADAVVGDLHEQRAVLDGEPHRARRGPRRDGARWSGPPRRSGTPPPRRRPAAPPAASGPSTTTSSASHWRPPAAAARPRARGRRGRAGAGRARAGGRRRRRPAGGPWSPRAGARPRRVATRRAAAPTRAGTPPRRARARARRAGRAGSAAAPPRAPHQPLAVVLELLGELGGPGRGGRLPHQVAEQPLVGAAQRGCAPRGRAAPAGRPPRPGR